MKACVSCHRVNKDNAEECIECGGKDFQNIVTVEEGLPPPFYNNAERYKEADDGKEGN